MKSWTLTLSCPDRRGIVRAVAGFLADGGCNILSSAQFRDETDEQFFMRVSFDRGRHEVVDQLRAAFRPIEMAFGMRAHFYDDSVKTRVIILVSRFGHCLNDLLYRYRIGALPIEIPAIVSNHEDFRELALTNDIPFLHLAVTPESKAKQEALLLDLVHKARADLVVLARYMQILSPSACDELRERAINIHHSFLPSFQGAKPYQQAHDRGVKLIGATAHYVTEHLDEGPIIEQDVARVDHAMSVEDYAAVGRDVESLVLARAVKWHVEHRVLLHGSRTIVFR